MSQSGLCCSYYTDCYQTTPMCKYIWITSDWEQLFWVDFPSLLSTRRLKPRTRQTQTPKVLVFFLAWQWPMSKPSLTCTAMCPVLQQQYTITHKSTEEKKERKKNKLTSQTVRSCWCCCKIDSTRVPHTFTAITVSLIRLQIYCTWMYLKWTSWSWLKFTIEPRK